MFSKIIQIIFLASLIIFVFSYFQKNKLPEKNEILGSLWLEPIQTKTKEKPFQINKKDTAYKIIPKYSYEIYGLIVSEYDSENILDITHQADPLNTQDLCVIWGNNVKTDAYKKMKYSHGEFTCSWQYKFNIDSSWYGKFSNEQISNNHLLPKDDEVYRKIKQVKVGDQIYIKGYLVDYYRELPDGSKSGSRITSTTRGDTGNGACEVIYVTDFEILKRGNPIYRDLNNVSKYTVILSLISLLITLLIPPRSSNKISISDNFSRYRRFDN